MVIRFISHRAAKIAQELPAVKLETAGCLLINVC